MKNPILKIVKWFCRQLTFNELAPAVVIFHEVLSSAGSDIVLKPPDRPPHYRKFRVDTLFPKLGSEPDSKKKILDWRELQKQHEHDTGKKYRPSNVKAAKHLLSVVSAPVATPLENAAT